jgi:hypothetical protein
MEEVRMRKTLIVTSVLLAVGLVLFLSGCGEKKPAEQAAPTTPTAPPEAAKVPTASAKLPEGLAAWQAEATKGKAQIAAVLATLDGLVAAADTDPRPKFEQYKKDIAALEAQAAAVRSRGDAVRSQGNAYFAAWEEKLKTIGTADIAKIAAARRDELNKEYTAVTAGAQKTGEAFDPFMSDLKDISKVLENDLNAEGVKSIAPLVAKLKDHAKVVTDSVDAVTGSLNKIAAIYSPAAR